MNKITIVLLTLLLLTIFISGCSGRTEVKGKYFSISVPNPWQYEWEKDVDFDTLMIWREGSNSTLRISSIVLESVGNFSAEKDIQEQQQKYGGEISQKNGFYVLSFQEETTEKNTPLVVDFWHLEKDNRIIIVSFTMLKEEADLLSTQKEREEIKNFIFDVRVI